MYLLPAQRYRVPDPHCQITDNKPSDHSTTKCQAMLLVGRLRRIARNRDARVLNTGQPCCEIWVLLPDSQRVLDFLEAAIGVKLRNPFVVAVVSGQDPNLHRPRDIVKAQLPRLARVT